MVFIRDGHDNLFTPLRMLMALAVLVGHAMIIGARDLGAEPMVYAQFSISYMAVNAFFIASGFLVTASMMHRKSIAEFVSARGLRIYPALIAHVLGVMFIVGLFNTNLPVSDYLRSPKLWAEPFKVLSFADTNFLLPGVFTENYEPYASAPLWTLRYEVLAYIGTGLAFSLGLMKSRWMVAVPFVGFSLAWPLAHWFGIYDELPATLSNILRFGIPYGLGAFVWAYREKMPFRYWVWPLIALMATFLSSTIVGELLMNLFVGYGLFLIAYAKLPGTKWTQRLPDLSYGIYIWHWPILQWMSAQMPGVDTATLLLIGTPVTIAISWVSWTYLEKPLLGKKGALANRLRRKRTQAVSP